MSDVEITHTKPSGFGSRVKEELRTLSAKIKEESGRQKQARQEKKEIYQKAYSDAEKKYVVEKAKRDAKANVLGASGGKKSSSKQFMPGGLSGFMQNAGAVDIMNPQPLFGAPQKKKTTKRRKKKKGSSRRPRKVVYY